MSSRTDGQATIINMFKPITAMMMRKCHWKILNLPIRSCQAIATGMVGAQMLALLMVAIMAQGLLPEPLETTVVRASLAKKQAIIPAAPSDQTMHAPAGKQVRRNHQSKR